MREIGIWWFIEWDAFRRVRRERIYPFRNVGFISWLVKWYLSKQNFGVFPSNQPNWKQLRFGMHECIPYELLGLLPFNAPVHNRNLAERINAFPTKIGKTPQGFPRAFISYKGLTPERAGWSEAPRTAGRAWAWRNSSPGHSHSPRPAAVPAAVWSPRPRPPPASSAGGPGR